MDEPRLIPVSREEILFRILKKYRLPAYYSKEIERYLSGELSENRLVCCHSGCDICEENIYEAVKECREILGESGKNS